MEKTIVQIIYIVFIWLLTTTAVNCALQGFAIPSFSRKNYPLRYTVAGKNRIDLQKNHECSGYAAAYILRHLGVEATGEAIYRAMPNKLGNGDVYPKGIVKLLRRQGLKAVYRIGSLARLKEEVSKGIPVIAFIKIHHAQNIFHFVPVVGYDEESIYLAESLSQLVNAQDAHYNRKLPTQAFKRLWNTSCLRMPLYRYTYITVSQNREAA